MRQEQPDWLIRVEERRRLPEHDAHGEVPVVANNVLYGLLVVDRQLAQRGHVMGSMHLQPETLLATEYPTCAIETRASVFVV